MSTIEDLIKRIALDSGAAVVGIGSRERLSDAPPSGDPAYLLPSTVSIISYAIPYNGHKLRDFFSKKEWRAFGDDQKSILKILYGINDTLVGKLKEEGHEALGVNTNCVYRPETGAEHITDITEFVPDFSHQYGAVAAGLGRLGWSGNLLIPGYGAAVLLGTVLTSAHLTPDPLCEQNPCDRCGLCTLVCPVQMMSPKKAERAIIAGITEEIAARQPNTCCFIGCGDYHGLSPDGKWSNWSPYRLGSNLPEEKPQLDALNIRLQKADPIFQVEKSNFTGYRGATFDSNWHFSTVCGNCRIVCWKDHADREANMQMLRDSGVAVLSPSGEHVAADGEVIEIETPFLVRVAILKEDYEAAINGSLEIGPGYTPIDSEVLKHVFRNNR